MRRLIAAIILLLPCISFSQTHQKALRTSSWQTLVYKISAADAELFYKWDSIPVDRFLNATPIDTTNYVDEDELPIGYYVWLTVEENYIKAEMFGKSDLIALGINNKRKLQIDVRTKTGEFISDAKVYVDNKPTVYHPESKTYWAKLKPAEETVVKVYARGDTLFTTFMEKDENERDISEQRRRNYKRTRLFRYLNWAPHMIRQIIYTPKYKNKKIGARGYIIFNQPKYKPLDTVKFKGYVLNKKLKQYKKNIDIYISYSNNGKNQTQLVKQISPISAGAYTGEFIIADSLPMDTRYTLLFKTKKGKDIISERFKTEDYLLDDIGKYDFRNDKEVYFRNDSIRFFASAKDANGLNVMDGTAELTLTTESVKTVYQDTLFVIDTIYTKEIKLLTVGETKFVVPSNILPSADLKINAALTFRNSNNELHTEREYFDYRYQSKQIIATQKQDSMFVVYLEDGIEKAMNGEMEINDDTAVKIKYPYAFKIDPIAEEYTFYADEKNSKQPIYENVEVEESYKLDFSRINKKDTMGFVLRNPYKVPVYYTVFDGRKIIASGKASDDKITWTKAMTNPRKLYELRWQYIWAGKEIRGEESLALLYKLLKIKISTSESVFPGQKDSIHIDIEDYKGKPANNVNLAAVSYNNQFNNSIRVNDPPYLPMYKIKRSILKTGFERDEDDRFSLSEKYLLGKNLKWIEKFHLDTMTYYQMLFPKKPYFDATTQINSFVPQVAVHVVQKGVPQPVYLLYLNKEFVYYNGITDTMQYAFETYPENVHIGIRLLDKYIEIDSIYLQPGYKHDLSFDLDNLPQQAKVTKKNNYWDPYEMNLLNQTMWRMPKEYSNNSGYLWQDSRVVKLAENAQQHIAGPFKTLPMTFYVPGSFDITYNFEQGYQYSFSKQIVRLERIYFFNTYNVKNYLPHANSTFTNIADTISLPPIIAYAPPKKVKALNVDSAHSKYFYSSVPGTGMLQYHAVNKINMQYIVIEPEDTGRNRIVLPVGYYQDKIRNIPPGKYTILFITDKFEGADIKHISIKANGTEHIRIDSLKFDPENKLANNILAEQEYEKNKPPAKYIEINRTVNTDSVIILPAGNCTISGTISDGKGKKAVIGAAILLKKYGKATASNEIGYFSINNIKAGKYLLEVSSVGYETKEIAVDVNEGNEINLDIVLNLSTQFLQEVVVVGYGNMKRKDVSGAISSVSSYQLSDNYAYVLNGKVSGVSLNFLKESNPGAANMITIRGVSSLKATDPLYVIDGVMYRKLPANFSSMKPVSIDVLNDESAFALYGANAAGGVVIITTDAKTFRKDFKDYALWQPNFFTDKNGHAAIEINYPDNITGWKTFVIGMDKKRRMGKASILTQSYKPITGELSVPQFLLEGDSATLIGKNKNYTTDKYNVSTEFIINKKTVSTKQKELIANDAATEMLTIAANNTDTITAGFTLESSSGFKDGEERKIPVFKKGTEETIGNFWTLRNDTTVSYTASKNSTGIHLYAQNNTLDLMLEELDHLRQYPYYCMEQTASKLTGLALEEKIKKQLHQPFKNKVEMDRLLQKLQKAQQFNGSWSWWDTGTPDFYISNYITNALLQFRETGLVETNIRNAFLYLQNQLNTLNKNELLEALVTLSNGKHEMDYSKWLKKISFDSLSQHQQWQWVQIKQQQKMNYQSELKQLLDKKIGTMLGGAHWGTENYLWYSNEVASTVLAFNVLKNEPGYKGDCDAILQYFLTKRKNGYWRNTVESATILNAILPTVLAEQPDFTKPAVVTISGDTNFVINNFPNKTIIKNDAVKNLQIKKSGGGLVYFTAYEKQFNPTPTVVDDKFVVSTYFEKSRVAISQIKAGEKVTMILKVNVLKDADYVMMELPIPAGCTYAAKNNDDWEMHKEFLKNKVMFFSEHLSKGVHQFEIELEPRYSGTYTLNPAKVELMYFPVFYGRNELKKVAIQ